MKFEACGKIGLWRRVLSHVTGLAVATTALVAVAPTNAIANDDRDDATIRVMTRNLYIGSEFDAITAAGSFPALVAAATQILQNIQATKPAERAAAVAREIDRNRVDLIGIQEAAIVRTGPFQAPPNPATFVPATNVLSDELDLLVKQLAKLGERYEVVAIVPGVDAQVPTGLGVDGRLTSRIAIIAKASLKVSNVQAQGFLVNESFNTVGGPIVNNRGWASVDVEKGGRKFRFATRHLVTIPVLQGPQAHDMINGAGNTTMPVVFVGDFNANATTAADPTYATYQKFLAAGFKDAWPIKRGTDPGLTCCQAANILNPISN